MLQLCPFCGHFLAKPLADGISSCKNCARIFDSNPMNRLLSGGWLVRRKHYEAVDDLMREGFTRAEAELVVSLVVEGHYSHAEFCEALRAIGITEQYTVAC